MTSRKRQVSGWWVLETCPCIGRCVAGTDALVSIVVRRRPPDPAGRSCMPRVRRPAKAVLALALLCLASGPVATLPLHADPAQAAAVVWPPSTLIVSEVVTGGSSASDEFVEIANQGGAPVDIAGLEVVYATSSGSTVTRKATWAAST